MFETEEQSAIKLVVRLPHHQHQQYASVYAKTYPYQDLPPLKHLFSLFTKQNAWQVGAIPAPQYDPPWKNKLRVWHFINALISPYLLHFTRALKLELQLIF